MSEILDEQISAFLDGELPSEELELLLTRLDRDPAQRATLGRYAMIGECLRTGAARPEALRVADGVRSALLSEPAAAQVRVASDGWPLRGWLAAGMAATIAVVAFLVVQSGARQQPAQQPRLVSTEVPGIAAADDGISTVKATLSHRLDAHSAARLTGYLVAHGEYANQLSRSTLDSHLVTARAERAAWRQPQDPADVR